MKKLLCITAILCCCLSLRGQEAFSHTIELGVGGANFNPSFLSSGDLLTRAPGLTMYAEYRFGITNWLAIGAQLDFKTSSDKLWENIVNVANQLRYFQESIKLVAEVKLFPKSAIKPFIGVTVGPGFGQFSGNFKEFFNSLSYCDIGPRVGLQLGKHIRASVNLSLSPGFGDGGFQTILDGNFSSLGVNLGYAF